MSNVKGKHFSEYDVIVVGSGIAGMFAAIKASRFARVCLVTKDAPNNTNTWLAQGGIAAAQLMMTARSSICRILFSRRRAV